MALPAGVQWFPIRMLYDRSHYNKINKKVKSKEGNRD